MPLITVFFPYEDTFAKAIIDEQQVDFFTAMGAKRTPGEAVSSKPEPEPEPEPGPEPEPERPRMQDWVEEIATSPAPVVNGDKGFGEPGSVFFHELEVNGMKTFVDIKSYVFDITGRKMHKKPNGKIENYRRTAMKLIKEFVNGSQSG